MECHHAECLGIQINIKSATGNYGQLNDFKNIYITDASILPTSLGVNPQQSISSLVMRNVDHFLNCRKII